MAKKSLQKRLLSSPLVHFFGTLIFSLLLRSIYCTSRVHQQMPAECDPYLHGEKPAIFCFWHGRMIMHPFIRPPRSMHVLISQHNDGALITRTMRWFGIDSVRVARKRGSTPAMRELFAVTQRAENIAITPDGPRGPFQKAADGAAYVAMKTGYPLIPVTFSARRHWRLRSWDKFMIPKWCTQIQFVADQPIFVVGDDDDAALAATTAMLEKTLVDITAQADIMCGVVP